MAALLVGRQVCDWILLLPAMLWFGVPSWLVRLRPGWPGLLQLLLDCCVALRSYCDARDDAEAGAAREGAAERSSGFEWWR